jgi:hypothetical protein
MHPSGYITFTVHKKKFLNGVMFRPDYDHMRPPGFDDMYM